jgi:hypothetical protein
MPVADKGRLRVTNRGRSRSCLFSVWLRKLAMTSASARLGHSRDWKLWLTAVSNIERFIAMLLTSLQEHCIARG